MQYCCFYAASVFPSSVCSQFYLPASQNEYYHSHTGRCPEFVHSMNYASKFKPLLSFFCLRFSHRQRPQTIPLAGKQSLPQLCRLTVRLKIIPKRAKGRKNPTSSPQANYSSPLLLFTSILPNLVKSLGRGAAFFAAGLPLSE